MSQLRCYTCLELDRNLMPLSAYAEYIFTVLCPKMFYKSKYNTEFLICWECEHMAAKIRRFQVKLKNGNNILKMYLKVESPTIEGLSSHMITKVEIIDIPPQNLPQERPQNLPIVPQQIPIVPQILPIVPQILPVGQMILPTGPQNLPIALQRPPILPQNILELSLKDMLETPSKIFTETEIKLETEDEHSSSDFLDEDPLLSLRSQDQQKQWVQVKLPSLTKPIKEEMEKIPETSIAQNVFREAQTPLRGIKEAVKVTVIGPDKAEGSTSKIGDKDEALAKCQKKNYLLTKLLSNPTKGEELFVMRQNQDPSSSKNDSESNNPDPYTEDAAILIILSGAEVEELRKKKRSNNAYITSQYKCEKCIQHYFTQEKLDQHNLKHDESQGNSICGICEQRFIDDNLLNEHYKQHFIVYECLKCPYRHNNRANLTYHIRTKHKESKFFCKKCSEVFKTHKERRWHIEIAHDQKLACKMCTKTFVNLTKLKMHEYQVHKDDRLLCPICKKDIKKYYLKSHLKIHRELDDLFFCADCGTFYKSKATYELHIQNSLKHNSLRLCLSDYDYLKCDHCDKYFRTKESLKNHLREIGGLHYTCDYCNMNLKYRKQLVAHIRKNHMKILQKKKKTRICEYCGKSFTIPLQPLFLCWECMAILKKIQVFQEKLKEAQRILAYHYVNKQKLFLQTLSKLSKTYSNHTIFMTHDEKEDESKQKIEIKKENEHSNDSYNNFIENDFCTQEIKKENIIDTKVTKKNKSLHYRIVYEKDAKKVLRKKFNIQPEDLKIWLDSERNSDYYKKIKYKCKFCIEGFNTKEKLKRHIFKCHDESSGSHVCPTCSIRFTSESLLSSHTQTHQFVWECVRCGFQCYTVKRLDAHIRTHRVIQCLNCEAKFQDLATFYTHYKSLHSIFLCEHCGKRCKTKNMLEKHMSRHLDTHTCPTCSRHYKSRAALRKHFSLKHSACVAEQAYCVLCDKQYDSEPVYRRHVHTSAAHRRERDTQVKKKFPCPECNNTYSRRAYMMNHYRHVHMNQSKYYCSQCDRHFLNRTRYVDHMRFNHEGVKKEKNKLCNICGRGFAANRTLLNHMRTHSGERPYECEYCAAKFTQRTSMLSHVKYIHMKSKRRPQWQQ